MYIESFSGIWSGDEKNYIFGDAFGNWVKSGAGYGEEYGNGFGFGEGFSKDKESYKPLRYRI